MKDAKLQWKRDSKNAVKEYNNDLISRSIYFPVVYQWSNSASDEEFMRLMEEFSQVSLRVDPSFDSELSIPWEQFKKESIKVIPNFDIDSTKLSKN